MFGLFEGKAPPWARDTGHTAKTLEGLLLLVEQLVASTGATTQRSEARIDTSCGGRVISIDMARMAREVRPGMKAVWPELVRRHLAKDFPSLSPVAAREPARAARGSWTSYRPVFSTNEGPYQAGSAFVLAMPQLGYDVGVTCQHVFGPAGGLPRAIPAHRLPSAVANVALRDGFTSTVVSHRGNIILVAGANADDPLHDLALFEVRRAHDAVTFPLADGLPKHGEPLELVAQLRSGGDGRRTHSATMHRLPDMPPGDVFAAIVLTRGINLGGVSGAPVVDTRGGVAGVVVGGREIDGDSVVTVLGVTRLRALLTAALPPGHGPSN